MDDYMYWVIYVLTWKHVRDILLSKQNEGRTVCNIASQCCYIKLEKQIIHQTIISA